MPSLFRVIIQATNTATRGPSTVTAIIDDAKDAGVAEQANGPGECYFTLPMNHPQISAVQPLLTHYKVQRRIASNTDSTVFTYDTIAAGLIDDYDATPDEVVFYGRDYLSLYATSITPSNTSYSSQYVGQIIQKTITAAAAETNSRVNFITTGTIENTSTTTIALTSFQSRLEFMAQLANIAMSDQTVTSIIKVAPRSSDTPSITFTADAGTASDVLLEYGGLVSDFFYSPGMSSLRTKVQAIGQKREGATLLYSTQTSSLSSPSTYGSITEPMLFTDVIDQAALDDMTRRQARLLAAGLRTYGLSLRVHGLGPWEGFDLGDTVRVKIDEGIVQVDDTLTVWGLEWHGRNDGSEDLILSFDPYSVMATPAPSGGGSARPPKERLTEAPTATRTATPAKTTRTASGASTATRRKRRR